MAITVQTYACTNCGREFRKFHTKSLAHEVWCGQNQGHPCEDCQWKYESKELLYRHRSVHNNKPKRAPSKKSETRKKINCDFCNFSSEAINQVIQHEYLQHKEWDSKVVEPIKYPKDLRVFVRELIRRNPGISSNSQSIVNNYFDIDVSGRHIFATTSWLKKKGEILEVKGRFYLNTNEYLQLQLEAEQPAVEIVAEPMEPTPSDEDAPKKCRKNAPKFYKSISIRMTKQMSTILDSLAKENLMDTSEVVRNILNKYFVNRGILPPDLIIPNTLPGTSRSITVSKILRSKNQIILNREIVELLELKRDILFLSISKLGKQQIAKAVVRIRRSNRITIPKDVIQILALEEGDALNITVEAV